MLLSGAKVFGTSLRSQPDTTAEFLVRSPGRAVFDQPDTIQIPIAGIEVAVSSVPLAGGSKPYVGPHRLGPLPRAGAGSTDPVRYAVVALTTVAILGTFARRIR